MKEFDDKNRCEVYIPFETKNDELFVVELLELCECYLEPIKYGVNKNDIIEMIDNGMQKVNIIDFLKMKRYIADDNCFFELAKKYATNLKCVKIIFNDICYNDIEELFTKYSINEIRNVDIFGVNKLTGKIDGNGYFI